MHVQEGLVSSKKNEAEYYYNMRGDEDMQDYDTKFKDMVELKGEPKHSVIEIPFTEYHYLRKQEHLLNCLALEGVDSWEYFEKALSEHLKYYKEEEE